MIFSRVVLKPISDISFIDANIDRQYDYQNNGKYHNEQARIRFHHINLFTVHNCKNTIHLHKIITHNNSTFAIVITVDKNQCKDKVFMEKIISILFHHETHLVHSLISTERII